MAELEKYGIGQPVRRVEDRRLLTGQGRYTDDVVYDGMAYAVMLRSPYAHARIVRIDVAAAKEVPGVLAVLTGADWEADGLGSVPTRTPVKHPDGSPIVAPPRPCLNRDRVRYVGDGIAVIVAETQHAASDAAELVEVEYGPLPAVVHQWDAVEPDAPQVWDDRPGNVCVEYTLGNKDAVEAAFASAHHVTRLELYNNRVTAAPLEPRGAVGVYHGDADSYTLIASTQNIHANRNQIAKDILKIPPEKIRHVAWDVGGGFGTKNAIYPEYALVLWTAKKVGRPVKWISDRTDGFLSDNHGRDQKSTVELALDGDGRFLALRVSSLGNIGAYAATVGPFTPTGGTGRTQGGPYRFDRRYFESKAIFTHTVPTDPYRGAGRPEASFQMERVVNVAAAEMGIDALEIRRRNALRAEDLPFDTGMGATLDSGDFLKVLDMTAELADWQGFPARREEARQRGKLRGIGIGFYFECSGGAPKEHAKLKFDRDGTVTLLVGSQSHGQGHETVLSQLVAGWLGIPIERIRYMHADTDLTPVGGGYGGSRGLEIGGSAVREVTNKVIEKAKRIAAHLLEAAEADIEFGEGRFTVAGTDRTIAFAEVLAASFEEGKLPRGMEPGLDGSADFERSAITFPNGCHIAEVEIDPETGITRLVHYAVVDDFGTIINPLTADGQVMGGTAQGIGQALMENIVHDGDGQLLSASFMDYCMPRADDLPDMKLAYFEDAPTKKNVFGSKGAGEAGCVGAPPAVVNAVCDALREYGVRHIDMPLTAEKVWRAVQEGRRENTAC